MRTFSKISGLLILAIAVIVLSVLFSNDPISRAFRNPVQNGINHYIEKLAHRAASGNTTRMDKIVLRSSVSTGILLSSFNYPEAASLLRHYLDGSGSDLRLEPDYFKESKYLNHVISKLAPGEHGPIALTQEQDWRLSLALNPYYLKISEQTIRIYHPKIEFAAADGVPVHTIVPIGRLKLKVYDNLVSALDVTPFYVFSEWSRELENH